jgi:hypothetical protein
MGLLESIPSSIATLDTGDTVICPVSHTREQRILTSMLYLYLLTLSSIIIMTRKIIYTTICRKDSETKS